MNVIYHVIIGSIVWSTSTCHVPFAQPGFLSTPAYIEGNVNETVLVPCVVRDLGKSTLRWWKDGNLISDSGDDTLITPPRVTVLTNNMLLVDWLEPEDAGNYTCEIVRPYPRSPLEQVHTVRVRYPPKIATVPTDGYIEAVLGSDVQMGCMAAGWPNPIVTWRFKDQVITSVDSRHKLAFRVDDASASGVYTCEAKNDVGKAAAASILLRVIYAPTVRADRTWVHSCPGMRTEIACTIAAEPRAKVDWLFDGRVLDFDSSRVTYGVRGDDHVVTFRNVLDGDFGTYTCRARNKVGHAEERVELSGLAHAAVFKAHRGLVAPDSYSFVWEVDSYSPIIEYRLMFREAVRRGEWIQLIIPADADASGPLHSKSYTISGLKALTAYEARVLSRNRFGWSEPSDIVRFGSEGAAAQPPPYDNEIEEPVTSRRITVGNGSRRSATQSPLLLLLLVVVVVLVPAVHAADAAAAVVARHAFPVNL